MYCKNCGAELSENSDVCLRCGALIKKNKPTAKVGQQQNSSFNNISDKIANLLCIISLVLAVAILFYPTFYNAHGYTAFIIKMIIVVVATAVSILAFIAVWISNKKNAKQSLMNLGVFQLGLNIVLFIYSFANFIIWLNYLLR